MHVLMESAPPRMQQKDPLIVLAILGIIIVVLAAGAVPRVPAEASYPRSKMLPSLLRVRKVLHVFGPQPQILADRTRRAEVAEVPRTICMSATAIMGPIGNGMVTILARHLGRRERLLRIG